MIEATGSYRWLHQCSAILERCYRPTPCDCERWCNVAAPRPHPRRKIPTIARPHPSSQSLGALASGKQELLRWLIARHNMTAPYKCPFGPRGLYWFHRLDKGSTDNQVRDELLERHAHYTRQLQLVDARLEALKANFPQCEALLELHGIGTFMALVLIAEWGDVTRFHTAKQGAAYTVLTARVEQSGEYCHHGHITKQGSLWLRWDGSDGGHENCIHDIALANPIPESANAPALKL